MKLPAKTGDLKHRIRFDAEGTTQADGGGTARVWSEHCTRWGRIIQQRGGEQVQAQRLQGEQPSIIIVRKDSLTSVITPAMRAVELRDGVAVATYALKTAVDMEGDGQFITLQAVSGAADS